MIVGLGNPGREYAETRHNVGFHVVDAFVDGEGGATWQRKFRGVVARMRCATGDAWLLKPETYMNLSGDAVSEAVRFFRVEPKDLLVVHDDMELDLGRVLVKEGGGHGGHNGLKSIEAAFGEKWSAGKKEEDLAQRRRGAEGTKSGGGGGFGRVRCGIGRPPEGWDPADFVLATVPNEDRQTWKNMVDRAADAVRFFVEKGLVHAMNRINRSRRGETSA